MARWRVSWTVTEGNYADSFNVYVRPPGGDWRLFKSTPGNDVEIDVVEAYESFEVGIATVVNDLEMDSANWEIVQFNPTSLEDIPPPGDVSELSVSQVENSFDVRLRWPAVSDPHLDSYEVREDPGGSWEDGVVRKTVPTSDSEADLETTIGMMAARTTIFLVKAVSVHGQYSGTEATATITLQEPATFPIEATHDEHAAGFTGTKTDTEVDAGTGDLQVEAAPEFASDWSDNADTYSWFPLFPHLGEGTYVTPTQEATDGAGNGIVVDEVIEVDLAGAQADPYSQAMVAEDWRFIVKPDLGGPDFDEGLDVDAKAPADRIYADETLKEGQTIEIEIDTTPDDPSSSPTWDGWRKWVPGTRYRYRGVRLRFRFLPYWWKVFRLNTLTWRRYRKNLKDEAKVSVGAGPGGTAVSFNEPFTKAPAVVASVDSSNPGYVTVKNITRTGCDVYAWDDANPANQIAVTAHVVAAGV